MKPQLTELVKQPPDGPDWFHEIKYDGYRIHARIDDGDVRLLTRTGLDWTRKYPPIAASLEKLPVGRAYFDGELCGVRPDGTTSFSIIQAASDSGNAEALVFFLFDLLFLNGEDLTGLPLSERKSRLATVMSGVGPPLQYSDNQIGRGPTFYAEACKLGLEGIVSKRADAPYVSGDRGLWVKTKCLNREESRHRVGNGDICLDRNDAPARCSNFARGCFRLNRAGCIVYADRRATGGQRLRNRPSDAARSSRHDYDLLSPARHFLPSRSQITLANADPPWVCSPPTPH